jgi:ATP-binding cassette, subfamily B, bacterial
MAIPRSDQGHKLRLYQIKCNEIDFLVDEKILKSPKEVWENTSQLTRNLVKAIGLVWGITRKLTVIWACLLIVQGFLPVATVYLTRAFINSLTITVTKQGADASRTILLALLFFAIYLANSIIGFAQKLVKTQQSEIIQDNMTNRIHEKALEMDMAFFESPESFDKLYRAQIDSKNMPQALLDNLGMLAQSCITLFAMAGILLSFGIMLPVLLFAGTVPAVFVMGYYSRKMNLWRKSRTQDFRMSGYYDNMITYRSAAQEIRLFGLGNYFRKSYQDLRTLLRDEKISLAGQQAIAEFAAQLLGLAVIAVAIGWILLKAAHGKASLGDIAMLYQAFNQGQGLMRNVLGNVGTIYRNSMFVDDLFIFFGMQPAVKNPLHPTETEPSLNDGVAFDSVTFRYPGGVHEVIKDFSLKIPANKTTAIVGPNGAGKSTLTRLICRFYDPEKGRVLFDGIDAKEIELEKHRGRISVLFQEPVHFNASAFENIAYGSLESLPGMDDIKKAAVSSGADASISRLPHGYETVLGKWFGGSDLSMGEWQRVALARAFLRNSTILMLDEPTSSMDSWAENDWLKRFKTLALGKTALIITHRFTTAMQADIIHVMDNGVIVESGTHEDLIKKDGMYARSWKEQTKEYDHTA